MKRASLSIELLALDGQAPTEFRIFAAGFIETTKGVFKFDDKAADSVMAAVADWGNDYCVDYGHSMLSFFNIDPAESMKAAGWFTPQLRAGELWATNVQWTKKASDMLTAREARYISPAFNYDDDGRITELVNAALTNIPATKKQTPLVASRDGGRTKTRKERKMGKKNKTSAFTLYKLGLPPDASEDDVMAALDGLQERARIGLATKEKLEADARAKAAADEKARKEREGETDLATLAAKGATDAATSDKSRADSEKQLIELTGKKTYGEALGVVAAWKALPAEIEKLQQEIAVLKQQGQGATAEMLVDQGVREGKISPAQKEMWLQIGKKNPEMLKGFLDTASTVVPKKAAISPEKRAAIPLTAEQQRAAAKMGITKPEDLAKLSEQMAEVAALRAAG
jgi:phage I-like protein